MAERKNRSIVEAARAMLEEKSLQVLLGRGGKDCRIHPESDRRQSVSARAIFRNEAELATLESIRSIAYVHVPKEKMEEAGR